MSDTPEPLGYAIFREGKQIAVEKSMACAKHWIEADIVPLVSIDQRDELLLQVECSTITKNNMESRLNTMIAKFAASESRNKQLEKQRDELISVLEGVESVTPNYMAKRINDAISSAKGGA